jgi:hypothetical protein
MAIDIVIPTQAFHKIRARVIRCNNDGLTQAEKSVTFFIAAHASDEAGAEIAKVPTAENEHTIGVPDLLTDADERVRELSARMLTDMAELGGIMCNRYTAELAAKLAPPVKEPTND